MSWIFRERKRRRKTKMGLKEECLKIYRKSKRLEERERKISILRKYIRTKEFGVRIFGENAKYFFLHNSAQYYNLIVEVDGLLFRIFEQNNGDLQIELITMCQECKHYMHKLYLYSTRIEALDTYSKKEIGKEINKGYKPYYLCSSCKQSKQETKLTVS